MTQCWQEIPSNRPSFYQIKSTLSEIQTQLEEGAHFETLRKQKDKHRMNSGRGRTDSPEPPPKPVRRIKESGGKSDLDRNSESVRASKVEESSILGEKVENLKISGKVEEVDTLPDFSID